MKKIIGLGISFLRYLERYTKTDMVYLARGGFWLVLGQIASSGAAFALSITFANLLSPDSYGIYKYVLSINALLLIPTLTGIDTAVTQAVARKFEGTVIPGMLTKMRWGVIGSFASLAVSLYYYFGHNTTLSLAFFITAIFIPFTESLDIYNALLQGKKLFKTFTLFNSLTQIISVGSLIITALLTHNVLILIFVFFFSNTLLNGIFMVISILHYPPNKETDTDSLGYGKKLTGLYIVSLIANELDKLLVFHFLGAASLAVYTIATAPTEQLKGLLKNVQFLILPKLAENSHRDIRQSFFIKTWIFGGIIAVGVVLYIIVSPFLFHVFFPKYPQSIFYSQLIVISIVAASISAIFYTYIEVKRSGKMLIHFHIWSNVINISSLFIGIYFYGLLGMIIARIISRYFVLLLTAYLAKKV